MKADNGTVAVPSPAGKAATGTKTGSNPFASPFWVMVQKEVSDHVQSWRFLILLAIICLACLGSIYSAMTHLADVLAQDNSDSSFVFLKLFTVSDGTLPSFVTFVSFLGPLLGIGLGFDAVNSERNKGTLSRIMSQPVHRDDLLNAKFTAALIVIGAMFFALGFLIMGMGLLTIGIPPTGEEFLRMLCFMVLIVFYVAFWLNLSILFSVRFRQPATSALSGIAIWLFFNIFYMMLVRLVGTALTPRNQLDFQAMMNHVEFVQFLTRLSPSQLFTEATTVLLIPTSRLGFITEAQAYRAIPSPLSVGQSLLQVWPQLTGLIAATLICFAISYILFMRQEIRSR